MADEVERVGRRRRRKRRTTNLRAESTYVPNLLTYARIGAIPFILYFIDNYSPVRSFVAMLIYLGAALTDSLDGYIARKYKQISVLGKFLDPLADKLIVNAVLVFMVALGRVEPWVVVVLIARDLAVNGLRSIASAQGLVISASEGGKIKTALQLVAIMMLLIHFSYPLLVVGIDFDYHIAGKWLLYVSMVMSLYSGGEYMWHFLAAALKQSRTTPT